MMSPTKYDVTKIVNQKTVVDVLEINKLTDSSLAVKFVNEAIRNKYTIIVLK